MAGEIRHFHLLWEAMETLGADPTAQTPMPDVASVESAGLPQVIADPRTTIGQSLHGILVAELAERADNDAWFILATLADNLGQNAMAETFRQALADKERHLVQVREWFSQIVMEEAKTPI